MSRLLSVVTTYMDDVRITKCVIRIILLSFWGLSDTTTLIMDFYARGKYLYWLTNCCIKI